MYKKLIYLFIAMFSANLVAAQEVTVSIEESANGCGLTTDCSIGFACFDILMTVDQDDDLDSYNIWVSYDNTVVSRVNGGDDASCVIGNGGDTDAEASISSFRVGGSPTSTVPVTANVPLTVHTICFDIIDSVNYEGMALKVGGDKFNGFIRTTVTFNDGAGNSTVDDTVPEDSLILAIGNAPCLQPPMNMPPMAMDDAATTPEDMALNVVVTGNDTDADGNIDDATVTIVDAPNNGTAVPDGLGGIDYTPDPNFNGTDVFTYSVCDDGTPLPAQCDTAQVVITVSPVNDAPIAVDDTETIDEDMPVTFDVIGNDTDVDGNIDPTSVAEVDAPLNGTVTIDPITGEITYTPDPDFNGIDMFTYEVCDDGTPLPAQCDTAEVVVTVNPVNDNPVAVDDTEMVDEDMPVTIDVVGNDTDLDGNIDPTSVTEIDAPMNGTITIDPVTGDITYTPNPDFNGTDMFTYEVCDDGTPLPAQCDTAEVVVTINPVNDAPMAMDDPTSTSEDAPVTIPATGNDTDIDGNIDPNTLAEITPPSNGTATYNTTTGEIDYTPNPGFAGNDTLEYVICDDGTPLPAACDTAQIVITVGSVNDAPMAMDDAATTPEDMAVNVDVTGNDTDTDGNIDDATVTIVDAPNNGTATPDGLGGIDYTPDPDFNGADTLTYSVCDDGTPLPAQCDTAEVIFTVSPVNDAPMAMDDPTSTSEDTPVTIPATGNDTDIDGNIDPNTLAEITPPSNGTATYNTTTGEIDYTPNPGFAGNDTLEYVICDDGTPLPAACDTAQIVITVGSVNDAPTAMDDAATTPEDMAVNVDVTGNDTDTDGNIDDATVTIVDAPNNGTATPDGLGGIDYTPDPDFNGADTLTYSVCDDGTPLPAQCDTAEVIFTVSPVNDAPIATDDTDNTLENTTVNVVVIGNDADINDPLGNIDPTSVTIVNAPTNGTAIPDGIGGVDYTPNPGFAGLDTFTYAVCDDGNPLPALCDTAEVVITVGSVNTPPMVNDDTAVVSEDASVLIDVVANDTDSDGNIDSTSVAIVDMPTNGTAVPDGMGGITYTPDPNFTGMDTFTYTVCDDGTPLPAQCDTAEVIVTVTDVNDGPMATDDIIEGVEDTPVVIDVTSNDTDIDGTVDPTSVDEVTPPGNGTLSIDAVTGEITYTPDPNFNGSDTFSYVVCDDGVPAPVQCDTAEVIVDVLPVNDSPMAMDDNATTLLDTPVIIDVTDNDNDGNDPAGNIDPTSVAVVDTPTNGTLVVDNLTGDIEYTPNTGFVGMDTFSYVICDEGNPLPAMCDTAEVIVTVTSNNPPVGVTDSVTTDVDTPIDIVAITNDSDPDMDVITISSIVTAPVNGSAVVNPDGTITYTPNPGFTGPDFFFYLLCDDGAPSFCDTVLVYVDVIADIMLVDDMTTGEMDEVQVIDILGNDNIPSDSFDVAITSNPMNGSATINNDGSITYTPNLGFVGNDTIEYTVCIGAFCDTAQVFISVTEPPVEAYFPNAFSPNGDGENDLFVIEGIMDFPEAEMFIHNRWGDEVWTSAGPYMQNWNGTNFNGYNLPDGTYYYIIKLNDTDDSILSGFIEIRR